MIKNTEGYFDSTAALFKDYRQKMKDSSDPKYSNRLAQEVKKRIDQLSFICRRIKDLEIKIMQKNSPQMLPIDPLCPPSDWKSIVSSRTTDKVLFEEYKLALFEMEIFVESFYFLADRTRSILQHKKAYTLPGLQGFESNGVRNVRNHLLQHPEKHGMVKIQSFSVGGDEGPRLKISFSEGDDPEPKDKGLWINANEFKTNLERVLSKALTK